MSWNWLLGPYFKSSSSFFFFLFLVSVNCMYSYLYFLVLFILMKNPLRNFVCSYFIWKPGLPFPMVVIARDYGLCTAYAGAGIAYSLATCITGSIIPTTPWGSSCDHLHFMAEETGWQEVKEFAQDHPISREWSWASKSVLQWCENTVCKNDTGSS